MMQLSGSESRDRIDAVFKHTTPIRETQDYAQDVHVSSGALQAAASSASQLGRRDAANLMPRHAGVRQADRGRCFARMSRRYAALPSTRSITHHYLPAEANRSLQTDCPEQRTARCNHPAQRAAQAGPSLLADGRRCSDTAHPPQAPRSDTAPELERVLTYGSGRAGSFRLSVGEDPSAPRVLDEQRVRIAERDRVHRLRLYPAEPGRRR